MYGELELYSKGFIPAMIPLVLPAMGSLRNVAKSDLPLMLPLQIPRALYDPPDIFEHRE